MNYKVYKISNDEGKFYIGSTKNELSKRLSNHKSAFLQYLDGKKHYYTVYVVLMGTNCKIECMEDLGEVSNRDAKIREAFYISINPTCVNKNKPILSEQQKQEYIQMYRNDNKDKYIEYQRNYYKENKDKHKNYYLQKKDVLKDQYKTYYQANKDKIIARQKKYYETKKAKAKEDENEN